MPKLIMFIKRRDGLSHDEFRKHYESIHVPLAVANLPHLVRYERNYLAAFSEARKPDHDVVTEMCFDDDAGLAESIAWMRSDEGLILRQDQEQFMDQERMLVFIAEEVGSASTWRKPDNER